MGGNNLTAVGDGAIAEFDAFQDFLWQNYKIPLGKIWLGGTVITQVSKAISAP